MKYLKSLRLTINLLAFILVIVSFDINDLGLKAALYPAITVFFILCSCMLQNDWRDRKHDLKKGKSFANDEPKKFFLFLCTFWLVSLSLSLLLSVYQFQYFPLLLFLIILTFLYSELRKFPYMSALSLSLTACTSILFPSFFTGNLSVESAMLFVGTFILIFARETIKDIQDIRIDKNYKATLPVRIGERKSKLFILLLFFCSSVLIFLLTEAYLPPLLMIIPVIYLFHSASQKETKVSLDLVILFIMLFLLIK